MSLQAELRTATGSSASRKARSEGKIPVSLYGSTVEATNLLINRRAFEEILKTEGANAVFDLEYDGNVQKVLIKDFETAALKDLIYSVDLQAVSADEKLQVEVPVTLVNEETVKIGIVELVANAILIETTPDNIPSNFELDVEGLEIGDTLTTANLDLPENVVLVNEEEETIVSVSAPTEEPAEVDPDAEMAEPEVIGEGDNDEEE